MTDGNFEVHEIGTARELRLYRKLLSEIDQLSFQYGEGIIPNALHNTIKELKRFYEKQLHEEQNY